MSKNEPYKDIHPEDELDPSEEQIEWHQKLDKILGKLESGNKQETEQLRLFELDSSKEDAATQSNKGEEQTGIPEGFNTLEEAVSPPFPEMDETDDEAVDRAMATVQPDAMEDSVEENVSTPDLNEWDIPEITDPEATAYHLPVREEPDVSPMIEEDMSAQIQAEFMERISERGQYE